MKTYKRVSIKKQPTPKKGFEFTGWATFNWGICHNRVFRTRREAIMSLTHGSDGDQYHTWQEMRSHMKVVKVKCTVL